jgi:hypothetical protein
VPRRLLPLALAALALLGAGCADTVSPAVRVDGEAIGNDELLDEVEQWAGNPTLLQAVQFPAELVEGDAPGSYSTELVGFVLGSRIGFELHRAEFEARGLELTDEQRTSVRGQLFGDPAVTEQVFADFSDGYGEQLVDDVARQIALQEELGEEEYPTWAAEAYEGADVEVNPQYGFWDPDEQQVIPPDGPLNRSTPDPLATP